MTYSLLLVTDRNRLIEAGQYSSVLLKSFLGALIRQNIHKSIIVNSSSLRSSIKGFWVFAEGARLPTLRVSNLIQEAMQLINSFGRSEN